MIYKAIPRGRLRVMGIPSPSMKKGGAGAPAFPKRKQHSSKQYYNKNGGPDLPIRPNRSVADNNSTTGYSWNRDVINILFCKLASQINMKVIVPVLLLLATAAQALALRPRVLAHINNLYSCQAIPWVRLRPCLI